MSLAKSSPPYGTQPYPKALLDIYRSIRLMAQILNRSCVNQKKSFGTSTAGLLSGIFGLSGLCFLAARSSRLFLQHSSHQAWFFWAGCRWQLVHRPRSLACSRVSRRLRFSPSFLASGSMRGKAWIVSGSTAQEYRNFLWLLSLSHKALPLDLHYARQSGFRRTPE